ncbi:MAG: hypothetical protein ACHQ03_09805 [Candidatus Bathyarchaeia archaeon]
MRRSTLPCFVLVVFVLATFLTGHVSAQSGGQAFARITSVNAPSSVGLGQSLTVSVNATYQYNSNSNQSLFIEIADNAQGTNPFTATAIAGSCSNPPAKQSVSVCFANTTNSCTSGGLSCSGFFTTSFTLIAPNQTETWTLYVFGQITELNLSAPPSYNVVTQDVKIVQIAVT